MNICVQTANSGMRTSDDMWAYILSFLTTPMLCSSLGIDHRFNRIICDHVAVFQHIYYDTTTYACTHAEQSGRMCYMIQKSGQRLRSVLAIFNTHMGAEPYEAIARIQPPKFELLTYLATCGVS